MKIGICALIDWSGVWEVRETNSIRQSLLVVSAILLDQTVTDDQAAGQKIQREPESRRLPPLVLQTLMTGLYLAPGKIDQESAPNDFGGPATAGTGRS